MPRALYSYRKISESKNSLSVLDMHISDTYWLARLVDYISVYYVIRLIVYSNKAFWYLNILQIFVVRSFLNLR